MASGVSRPGPPDAVGQRVGPHDHTPLRGVRLSRRRATGHRTRNSAGEDVLGVASWTGDGSHPLHIIGRGSIASSRTVIHALRSLRTVVRSGSCLPVAASELASTTRRHRADRSRCGRSSRGVRGIRRSCRTSMPSIRSSRARRDAFSARTLLPRGTSRRADAPDPIVPRELSARGRPRIS